LQLKDLINKFGVTKITIITITIIIAIITIIVVLFVVCFNWFYSWHVTSKIKIIPIDSRMHQERLYYQSSVMCDGRVLLTGGHRGTQQLKGDILNSTEIFDPKTLTFEKGPDMNLPHKWHKQFTLSNCEIVIADINGIETYDPKTNKFTLWNNKIMNRDGSRFRETANSILLNNGNILVTGGETHTSVLYKEYEGLGDLELEKIRIDELEKPSWQRKRIYWNKVKTLPYTEILDTTNKKIIRTIDMPLALSRHVSFVAKDGIVYIFHGVIYKDNPGIENNKIEFSKSILSFNPKTNRFKKETEVKFYPAEEEFTFPLPNNEVLFVDLVHHPKYNPPPIFKYNPETKQFTKIFVPKYHLGHNILQTDDYKVYIFGSFGCEKFFMYDLENTKICFFEIFEKGRLSVYDPLENTVKKGYKIPDKPIIKIDNNTVLMSKEKPLKMYLMKIDNKGD
jgi:hypothetical protein